MLGNGSAFGADRAPMTRSGDDGDGDGACEPCAGAHASAATSMMNGALRIVVRDLLKGTADVDIAEAEATGRAPDCERRGALVRYP